MERYLFISDAAKEVQVESHVLRYWEEELHLPIRRNEMGHRYYTESDVELFKQIKVMKENGLQLKAIKMILKDGRIDVMAQEEQERGAEEKASLVGEEEAEETMAIRIAEPETDGPEGAELSTQEELRQEKARRLQWLLKQLFLETLQENNRELCKEIKESVVKELDYQFRAQEEREEEREKLRDQREEEHYRKVDALLRKKVRFAKAGTEEKGIRKEGTQKDSTQKDGPQKDSTQKDDLQKETAAQDRPEATEDNTGRGRSSRRKKVTFREKKGKSLLRI